MRSGAQIDKITVLITRYLLAFRNFVDQIKLEHTAVVRAFAQAAKAAALGQRPRLLTGNNPLLEFLVLASHFFHFGLDRLKVIGCDPVVWQVKVVIKPAFDGWAVGELGVRPEPQDGGGHDVGAGMAEALQI